jgi:hypothetical protein
MRLEMWRGKPIAELTREELVEALNWACECYSAMNDPMSIHFRALGRVEAMKRGEFG